MPSITTDDSEFQRQKRNSTKYENQTSRHTRNKKIHVVQSLISEFGHIHQSNTFFDALVLRPTFFIYIRFWYLRCCCCPWNRGRQHLATPLKTCHNTEAGFLTGWLLCLSPNSEVTASETPPFPHLGCVPAYPYQIPLAKLHIMDGTLYRIRIALPISFSSAA